MVSQVGLAEASSCKREDKGSMVGQGAEDGGELRSNAVFRDGGIDDAGLSRIRAYEGFRLVGPSENR